MRADRARAGTVVPAGAAQLAVERDGEQEGHAHRGEIAEAVALVEAVGIDDGAGARQRGLADMVIDHDHVEPGFGRRGQRRDARWRRNRP